MPCQRVTRSIPSSSDALTIPGNFTDRRVCIFRRPDFLRETLVFCNIGYMFHSFTVEVNSKTEAKMATFAERLKLLRERAGLTQEQLAEKLNVSPSSVGNYESGRNGPTRVRMRKIAAELNTTELFLSGESDIDTLIATHPDSDHLGALEFSRMTMHELKFIFESRQKELSEPNTTDKRKSEALGIIAEVAGEMKRRIDPSVSSEEIAVAGAQKIYEAAKKVVFSEPAQPSPANQPSDGGHQGSKHQPPGERSSKKH